jgi:hypothetical protein
MSYSTDMQKAARRHLEAVDQLEPGKRRDVAGYLYGIAAECAVKLMACEIGLRDQAILFAHFPELRTLLRSVLLGRRASPLARFVNDDAFMNNWHVKMRYCGGNEIRSEWIDSWKQQAHRVLSAMGT